MQIILKDVLQSKYKMSTNDFISNLKAKGIDVLFNRASPGYVSGVSYRYQGMIITGARLGNDFKWSTIKTLSTMNMKGITKEFTRQMLDPNQPSINFEQVTHAGRNTANTPGGVVQHGKPSDKAPAVGLFVYRPSFAARIIKAAITEADGAAVGIINTAFNLKFRKSSRLQRYSTATVVGIASALLTNLIWWIVI